MDNQQEKVGWSDAILPDLESDQYSDFEVIESSIEDGDDLKSEKISLDESHEDSDGLKIPKILISSIEPDDHEQDGEEAANLKTANGHKLGSDHGGQLGIEEIRQPKEVIFLCFICF